MAGLAASRIFAAGGAGGLVLTAWALRRSGMRKRLVADKTLTFLILTYIPYMAALIVCGLGLRLGIFPGEAPFALTVVPAIIAVILTGIGVSTALVPTDLQRRLEGFARGHGQLGRWAQRLANLPASASAGMRDALQHLRHPDPALAGAILFWACQVGVLWASVPRVRRRAAARGPHPGVLRRDVRQPAADAGRRRRRRGRDDRGARGVRRRRGPGRRRRAAVPRGDLLAADDPRRDRLLPAAAHRRAVAEDAAATTHYTK